MLRARIASSVAVCTLALVAAAQGNGPWTQVCNVTTTGQWLFQSDWQCDISHNGSHATFVAGAALDPVDTNGWRDVYVRDLASNSTILASRGNGNVVGDYEALDCAISSTGRYVAFQSGATNLVVGNDPGFDSDVFVRDMLLGTTLRCSLALGGVEPDNQSFAPEISGDGRFVSFVSNATNLLPNPGAYYQAFVFDSATGTLAMATSDATNTPGVGSIYIFQEARLSDDGRFCVFATFAPFSALDTNGTVDVYRKDLQSGQIDLVSADPATGQATPQGYSALPSISADGRWVAFETYGQFAGNDVTVGTYDVYVRDMAGNGMTLISVDLSGFDGTGSHADLSADGRHVSFTSPSNALVLNDNNGVQDVFVRDWHLGQTTRESVSYAGGDANLHSYYPAISANGRRLAFLSEATNLTQFADPNSSNPDCFARDRGPSATPQVYCIAKVNSQGCAPAIGYTGLPSATQANPFHVLAANVVNKKFGVLYYSVSGPAQTAFQGGWLCLQFPVRVPSVLGSGGSSTGVDCTGTYDVDFNAYIASGQDPALVLGQEFWAQYWSRDPTDPFTVSLTDALDAVIGP